MTPHPTEDASDQMPSTERAQLPLENSVGFRLSRLVRIRRARWATELCALGLTPPQAALLRATRDHPGQALRSLARTLKFDAMAVKRCVDELETRGWVVTSTRDDDRRVRVACLTATGADLVNRLEDLVTLQESTLRAQLSRAQLVSLCDALARLERAEGIDASIDHPTENEETL